MEVGRGDWGEGVGVQVEAEVSKSPFALEIADMVLDHDLSILMKYVLRQIEIGSW